MLVEYFDGKEFKGQNQTNSPLPYNWEKGRKCYDKKRELPPTYDEVCNVKSLSEALLMTLMIGLPAQAFDALSLGNIEVTDRNSPILIAAPHGGYDTGTEEIARKVAQLLNANCIVASGYRTIDHPINVNRPTEGVRLAANLEQVTESAQAVYNAYRTRVLALKPKLYIEIHANIRPESANAIEAATIGLTSSEASLLKSASTLPILIEPLDKLYYRASSAKRCGILSQLPYALHFELPTLLRTPGEVQEKSSRGLAQIVKKALNAHLVPTP